MPICGSKYSRSGSDGPSWLFVAKEGKPLVPVTSSPETPVTPIKYTRYYLQLLFLRLIASEGFTSSTAPGARAELAR